MVLAKLEFNSKFELSNGCADKLDFSMKYSNFRKFLAIRKTSSTFMLFSVGPKLMFEIFLFSSEAFAVGVVDIVIEDGIAFIGAILVVVTFKAVEVVL